MSTRPNKMRTLKQNNQDYLNENEFTRLSKQSTGISCDHCGKELTLSMPGIILTSCPAKEAVHCTECGFKGYKYA